MQRRDQNISKKTSDYRKLFTQLLDFSLNISKQGPLIGKSYSCALSLANYLINLESNKKNGSLVPCARDRALHKCILTDIGTVQMFLSRNVPSGLFFYTLDCRMSEMGSAAAVASERYICFHKFLSYSFAHDIIHISLG